MSDSFLFGEVLELFIDKLSTSVASDSCYAIAFLILNFLAESFERYEGIVFVT